MKYILSIFAFVFALMALPVFAADAPTQITIKEYKYVPATLNMMAGTKVTWVNQDDVPHTIIDSSPSKTFHSAALDTNDSYSFTFAKPGTYHYFCTLHPTMVGTIVVAPAK
jgi:plastocyanin